mgnify:CR=1 FL=1
MDSVWLEALRFSQSGRCSTSNVQLDFPARLASVTQTALEMSIFAPPTIESKEQQPAQQQQQQKPELKHFRAFENFVRQALLMLFVPPQSSLCEFLCGRGVDLPKIARCALKTYTAVDANGAALEEAKTRWQSTKNEMTQAEFVTIDVTKVRISSSRTRANAPRRASRTAGFYLFAVDAVCSTKSRIACRGSSTTWSATRGYSRRAAIRRRR